MVKHNYWELIKPVVSIVAQKWYESLAWFA